MSDVVTAIEGVPISLNVSTTDNSATATTFTMATGTYNGTAAYFASKVLRCKTMRIRIGNGVEIEHIKIDGNLVHGLGGIPNASAQTTITLDVADYFGLEYLTIRNQISVKAAAAVASQNIEVLFFGYEADA